MGQPQLEGPLPALGRRVAQVLAGGHEPGSGADPCYLTLEASGQVAQRAVRSFAQQTVQDQRALCGDGHPLAVERVEGADPIADHQEALRKSGQPLVEAALVVGLPVGMYRRQPLGAPDSLVQERAAQATGEGQEAFLIGGRVVPTAAGKGDHPTVAFDREQHASPRVGGRVGLEEEDPPVGVEVGWDRVVAAGIAEKRGDRRLGRRRVAELGEPLRRPRVAPTGVDDKPRPQLLGRRLLAAARRARPDPKPFHPASVRVRQQAGDVAALEEPDVAERRHPATNTPFQELPTGGENLDAGWEAIRPAAAGQHEHVPWPLDRDRACGHPLRFEAGEELLEDLEPAGEQGVEVPGLWHPLTELRAVGKAVAVYDRHAVEAIGKHARGQQPGHAPADDDRLLAGAEIAGAHGHPSLWADHRVVSELLRLAFQLRPGLFLGVTHLHLLRPKHVDIRRARCRRLGGHGRPGVLDHLGERGQPVAIESRQDRRSSWRPKPRL